MGQPPRRVRRQIRPGVDTARLLSYFASLGGEPRERYLAYVAANAKSHIKGLTL